MTGSGYRSFLLKAGLILALGVVIMAAVTGGIVWAGGTPQTATVSQVVGTNNTAGSFGITGFEPITLKPVGDVPSFIAGPLKEKRGVILLVYVPGSQADDQMLTYFNNVKAKYADRASFFSFQARKASELGNVLAQLKVSQPPALAVISPDGSVYQLYTGWIGQKVMEQVVANALAK